MSTDPLLSSHRLPSSAYSQNYNPRYADIPYNGPFLRDAHEENPESILDDHVQRVMKTPGCHSPGTGRHSPKSRSPDGFHGGKGISESGQGKHPTRHGFKGETSHLYHHKNVHHIPHTGMGKPKEHVEAEAAMRVHGNFPWSTETSYYDSKSRSYADGIGSNHTEHTGYRYGTNFNLFLPFTRPYSLLFLYLPVVFFHYTIAKVVHSVREHSRKAKKCGHMTCQGQQRRLRKTTRSFCG